MKQADELMLNDFYFGFKKRKKRKALSDNLGTQKGNEKHGSNRNHQNLEKMSIKVAIRIASVSRPDQLPPRRRRTKCRVDSFWML